HQVAHFGGPDYDYLFFAYPLTGSFRFTADVLDGGWMEGDVSYGGLCFEPFAFSKNAYIWPVGKHEQFTRSLTSLRQGNYNQISIEAEPEKFRFWVNGQMVFEQEQKGASPTAPWLAIYTNRERRSVFRNLRLSGRPEIPRQVSLLQADRLDGWLSNFYNESQPPRLAPLNANNTSGYWSTWSRVQGDDFDWQAKGGVLHGRRNQAVGAAEVAQSRLYYLRPLRDGDTLRYEFFYEPDAVMVYPALGRLAFLVEPDGVRLHWITDGEDDATGLPADNAAVEADHAVQKPPLKPGDWNTMELRLADDRLLLALNGAEIYRRSIEESNDRLFSFFHYKDRTAVQVRGAVLTGDWPQKLSDEEMANLLSSADKQADEGNQSLLSLLLGEENVFLSAWQIWQEARGLEPQRRYDFLREWVLPNPTIGGPIRLYGDSTPADPAPPVSESLGVKMPSDGRRVHTGGELVSPAIELVKTAQEIGKLDELKRQVETVPARDPATLRSQIALLALIALEGHQDDQAHERLSQLYTLAKQASDDDAEYLRLPALVAATQALNHEPSRQLVADMTHFMVDAIQRKYVNPNWERQIRHARDRARLLLFPEGEHATLEGGSPLVQWQPVTHATAASRGNAHPPAHWLNRPGELKHVAGHNHDYVYFSVPLRGDFQVDAQISTFGWREMETMYAGLRCGVVFDHKNFKVSNYERDRPNVPIAPPLDPLGNWYNYRLTVKDGLYTAAVNGRKVFEERLSSQPDPWLAFHSWGAYSGEVREVRITGQPAVPDVIDLTASANLDGWLADYYGESLGGGDSNWQKRGEEIYGRKLDDQHGAARESLLQYHRPMLEDGQIDYEFYYQPDAATAHPALDRLVLLLEPSGVRVHWLTDGAMERGGQTPDNAQDEPANRRGPAALSLRPNDWNRVRLTLTGDRLSLALNDVEIYQRDLEPTNQRTFGLFHFAQRSESRVRHVNYRGAWPRALPPLVEQELAVSPATRAAIDTKKLRAKYTVDFRGQKPLPKGLELIGDDQRKLVTRSAAGARVLLPAGQEKPGSVGYVTRFPIRGDFEIVAKFTGLTAKPAPPAWGPGIDLHLKPAGPEQYDVTFERRNDVDRPILQAGGFHTLVGPNDRVGRLVSHSQPAVSGTFKFVRKGPVLYYLFAAGDSDEFLLWDEAPIGTADINSVEFIARAFSPPCAVDVMLEQMSIRAESFAGSPAPAP
ncbi:MAG TPA: DUF1583 domain-containing protein, partial [Pirellulales bacterium]|nr:DUF1583 domain-containing protein [Pirellulales bacterium]